MDPTTIAHPPGTPAPATSPGTAEDLSQARRSLRHETRQKMIEAKENIRDHPRQATLIAFGTGLLLSFLPLAMMVTAVLRLGLFLAKPALLILGGVKAVEEYQKNRPA